MTETLLPPLEIEPRQFWGVIGCRAAGVAIVTTLGPDGPEGFLALSATHLSASPPLVTVSIDGTTSALTAIAAEKRFALNYLARGAEDIYTRFTAKDGPKGAARFEGLEWTALTTGAPVLPEITGVLDCRLEEIVTRGSANIAIGRIVNFTSHPEAEPMIHYQGRLLT